MADRDAANTFTKAPRKKTPPAKRVTLSPEMRAKYEEEIRRREELQRTYGQHLGDAEKGRR